MKNNTTTLHKKSKEMLSRSGMNDGTTIKLQNIAMQEDQFIYAMLESSAEGITSATAKDRIQRFGKNVIQHDRAPSWLKQLIQAFANPFILILLVIALISFVLDIWMALPEERDYKTVIVVFTMMIISALMRFVQEFRSNRAAEQLKSMVKTTSTVLRRYNGKQELLIEELVPGDVIFLSAGDMIPADCRILHCKDLFVSESMLTGEALPVEKNWLSVPHADQCSPIEISNICFMGTNVISGSASAIVVATGSSTYFGTISKTIVGERPETAFDKGVNKVSFLLIRFMLVMVPVILLINGLLKDDWMNALLFAVAVAVGLTPEMLPMIVTANLAKGALNMSKRKVIVKRLNAIQNIGAMDVLCTDKTGTLTMDKIVLEKHLNVYGAEDDEVLKWAYLNSYHQMGLKNLLDKAVLEHVELHDYLKVEEHYVKIDEIPFDFQRRRMSVVLKNANGCHLLICKGAVEEMLSLCTHTFDPGEDRSIHTEQDNIVQMNDTMRDQVMRTARKLNEEGLRVLLVAIREFEGNHPLTYAVEDENKLILTGFIGFLDPAKPSAAPSIKGLQELGIAIKVLTGDNDIVTRKICRDVGIPIRNIMLGDELDMLSAEELKTQVDDISVFAKLSPLQKVRVVQALREKGHTVGFMGDGINDAAALKESDVGISVDTAVDIAKESADIILLEKDLTILRKGVIYGRRTFGNIVKYIKMTASSNFGNMFSMLGASAFLPFLPMLPVQLLVQNLLYDVSQVTIPWDSMDKDFLAEPKKWDARGLQRFMLCIGPISSVFDFITFAVMFYVFKANSPEHQSLFQSGWFVEGLLSQTLIIHMIRTRKVPFIQSWATAPVVAMTSLIIVTGMLIPFLPVASALGMQPLPWTYFPWLIGILFSYCLLTQVVKRWYIRRFQEWL
ncbi:magnesium-importing ATPase [Sphingobacterium spiritivorum ATCC 33300]|uniref:Magnesium-transporting ATPase, P-type 1 n=1 Tax=Sphingobacterium spiritivorum ATCC 33300 TaxID=525372 RepID=C2G3R5_SPHSI|nr:magnesium-translocating P-type ATPase [Sphingobacterium spiritivorum]EEI90270.1 magnesium-importing ATPase [Sphingobacterium spiritivorum ATCC 33300]QQS95102.1 magnesium-translocating P-type ATPase [Sphingobacterium spiritivorum]